MMQQLIVMRCDPRLCSHRISRTLTAIHENPLGVIYLVVLEVEERVSEFR